MSNVPKLRFPEFSDPWLPTKAGKYFELLSGFPFKSEDISEDNSGIPILRGVNITEGKIRHSPEMDRFFLGDNTQHEKYIVQEGDIVLGMDGSKVGKNIAVISSTDSGSLLIQRVARLRDNRIGSLDFIFHHIFSYRFHRYVDVVNTSSGIPHISAKQINEYPITAPSKPEQQKIATFLSALDTKIEQLTQKEALLKQYKKGVMQKIFSQEIRFKADDGSEFPKWAVKSLREISKRKTAKNTDESIKQVLTNSATKGIVSQTDYFDKDIANQDNLGGYYIVDTDDFIYNPRISVSAPVGPIKRNHLSIGVMSPLYTVFELTCGEKGFFERYFETTLWHRYMNRIANFGARHDRMNVTTSDFYEMPMPYPSLTEQQKITDFLSELDMKLQQATEQLEAAKTFKKGLLQQMFV